MNSELQKRIGSFLWRWGVYVGIALSAVLMNIKNIAEINKDQLLTIFIITTATYVINEGTKWLNKS